MKVLFYVQHLLGIGHLARASRIARGLIAAGCDVTLCSGGLPVTGFPGPGIDLRQLTPVKAGPGGFAELIHADGRPFGDADKAARTAELLSIFDQMSPDCLVIEAFPFGRRQMRFELMPLLRHVREKAPGTLIACSVRDILQRRPADRDQKTADVINDWFDCVLVHGDPDFITLDETFSAFDCIAQKVRYTNIVAPDLSAPAVDGYDVVVSAGGGAVGAELLACALAARHMTSLSDARWLLLTGGNLDQHTFSALSLDLPANISIERQRPDFTALLAAAQVSVSQAGYNTVADILRAQCGAVLVPYQAGGETEQTERATRLADRGLATVVMPGSLDPARLAAAIDGAAKAVQATRRPRLNGARHTAEILMGNRAADR